MKSLIGIAHYNQPFLTPKSIILQSEDELYYQFQVINMKNILLVFLHILDIKSQMRMANLQKIQLLLQLLVLKLYSAMKLLPSTVKIIDMFIFMGKKFIIHFERQRFQSFIDDELVDMEYGTGAVKVSPAHDLNDYEASIRHHLPITNIFTDDGKINDIVPEFKGMSRYDAREAILKELKKLHLNEDEKFHEMRLGISIITGDVVEPVVKKQWFVNTNKVCPIIGK